MKGHCSLKLCVAEGLQSAIPGFTPGWRRRARPIAVHRPFQKPSERWHSGMFRSAPYQGQWPCSLADRRACIIHAQGVQGIPGLRAVAKASPAVPCGTLCGVGKKAKVLSSRRCFPPRSPLHLLLDQQLVGIRDRSMKASRHHPSKYTDTT